MSQILVPGIRLTTTRTVSTNDTAAVYGSGLHDVLSTPAMIALMESDTKIAAAQPKILAYHQQHLFEYAGAAGGWIDSLGYPFSRGRVFDVCETDSGQYDDAAEVFWASGCAFFVRSSVYHHLGGFDP